ncbi:MAG: hypothetical protein JSV36_06215 [Anaerolineae bacterium]|nr:MAG: hypothetical protein JSV36_06215 [Anaerolineae bacterium]
MASQTNVASFVLRFVQETTTESTADRSWADWHGVIKHVQTNEERHFTCFADAVAFIATYVSLDEFAGTSNDRRRTDDLGR